MRRRFEFAIEADFRRPIEVRAAVAELREKCAAQDWAILEALAMEVIASAAVDAETVLQVSAMALEPGRK